MEFRSNARRVILCLAGFTGILILVGCAADNDPPPAPQPPPTAPVTYVTPVFTPVGDTQDTVERSGVRITIATASYEQAAGSTTQDVEIARGVVRNYQNGIAYDTPVHKVTRTITPTCALTPDTANFLVTINNNIPHVFKGSGAVVRFQVAGRDVAVDQSQYQELSNLIIPPQGQAQIHLVGPPLATLSDKTNIALFIYDVVTETDAAGNPTKRENYQWVYAYSPETEIKQMPIQATTIEEPTGPPVVAADQPKPRHHH